MSAQIIRLDAVRSFRQTRQQVEVIPPPTHALLQASVELQQADFIRQVGEMLTKRIVDTQAPLPSDVSAILGMAYFALRGSSPGGVE